MNASGRGYRSVKTCRTWVSSLAACVLVAAGVVVTAPPASAQVCDGTSVPCAIGDTGPGGGIVFYDAGSVQSWGRYLEAAQDDLGGLWCKTSRAGYWEILNTRRVIGSGRANTEIIIQACGQDSAAGVAAAYRGGGKDDWFLPSKDELNALFEQRKVVGAQARGRFWSSSQARVARGRTDAWAHYPHDSRDRHQRTVSKEYDGFVLPIRAF